MPFTRPELRELLNRLLRSDADFDAFAGDRFPEASRRFTDGMDRVRKTTILLQYAEPERLADELRGVEKTPPTPGLPPAAGRIKILFLASNPISTAQVALEREARQIEERLRVGTSRDVFELVPRSAVRYRDLQRLLLQEKPHVLHFSGHGTTGAQLLLEDDDGNIAPVDKKTLVDLLGLLKHRLVLVVLNACDTAPLARALVKHVACAIGMRKPVGDKAALAFAALFYEALAFGEPVALAFRLACLELSRQRVPEEQTPILSVKPGVDAARLRLIGQQENGEAS